MGDVLLQMGDVLQQKGDVLQQMGDVLQQKGDVKPHSWWMHSKKEKSRVRGSYTSRFGLQEKK